jgi:hypothetical protein
MSTHILAAPEETAARRRRVLNHTSEREHRMNLHRLSKLILLGMVAAAVAVPVGNAANDRVQIAGKLVAPAQVSEAQLSAGHSPTTRLVAIGGALVPPSQMSEWESRAGSSATTGTNGDSSSGMSSGVGLLVVLAGASALIFRHRRRLVTA